MRGQCHQISHGLEGQFRPVRWQGWHEAGGPHGNTQEHVLAVRDQDVSRAEWGSSPGYYWKPLAEQRMSRVGNFDLGEIFENWVIDRGIKVIDRLTGSITTS